MKDAERFRQHEGPLPVVLVGAGAMGRNWIRTLRSSPHADLVGLVDLDLDRARNAAAEEGAEPVLIGDSLTEVAAASGAVAVVNVTVPPAHRPVNEEALRAGLPVLCEKPIAPTLADALQQAALAEATDTLLMVSQSRRYFAGLSAFRDAIRALGPLGTVSTEFFKAPHFGGYRDEMPQPLLVDMAIHQFDAVRYLTGAEPVAVHCSSWNPSWSWYAGDASAAAVFELDDGARYTFTGSWCAPGLETSWNGVWRVSGQGGSARWDGEGAPESEGVPVPPIPAGFEQEIAGSLADFVRALRSGSLPETEVHANIGSLAMVEAAVLSAAGSGARVEISGLLERRYAEAIQAEPKADVRARLEAWGSAERGLGGGA